MNRRSISILSAAAFAIAAALPAGAATIYSTGFEATEAPPFTVGLLNGQNGWTATSGSFVAGGPSQGGSQAVVVTGTNQSAFRAVSGAAGPQYTVSAGLDYISGTGGFSLDIEGASGDVAQVTINPNGSLTLLNGPTTAAGTVTLGAYNSFSLTADYTSNTYSFSLDNGLITIPGIAFGSVSAFTGGEVAGVGLSTAAVDNFLVTSNAGGGGPATPEPSTWVMFSGGLAMLGAGALRKRHALGAALA